MDTRLIRPSRHGLTNPPETHWESDGKWLTGGMDKPRDLAERGFPANKQTPPHRLFETSLCPPLPTLKPPFGIFDANPEFCLE